ERFGAAIRIPRRKFTSKRFHESIRALLENPEYKVKAMELMEESSQIEGARNVAVFLEKTFNREKEDIHIPRTPYTINRKS
ncbi:MAG TPA: hypothetical protein VK861_06490, partial [Bacteroidales bacterium]|nr:hypothetical protein [Bacteroidales bacterium]